MNLIELEQITPALIKSGKSLLVNSSPGQGKSMFTESVPSMMTKLLGSPFGFQSIFAATQTPTDLMGFMVPEKRGDKLISTFTQPLWMQTHDGGHVWDHEYGMLVIEEWGQGEAETKRAMAELLLNKRLGMHKLPPKWVVWALSNYASDRSGVTKDFDFLINRRVEINIKPDLAAWERWALRAGVGPIFIAFARQNPQIVFSEGVPDKQGPWCTPRSLVACEQVLMNLTDDEDGKIPTNAIANELATGTIGPGAASQLFATIQLAHVMPDFNDIVRDPTGTQVPDRPDARMLVCYSLAHRVKEATMEPVLKYVERFPKEFAITFAKSAVRRDDTLIDTSSFAKFCVNNQSLLGVIARAKL